jgi:hypothetical protein
MENATDIGETGFKLLETSQKMVTGGADQLIKIWNIGANSGKLHFIDFQAQITVYLLILCILDNFLTTSVVQ